VPLKSEKLADVGLLERADLQRMILQSSDAFFDEMGESLKIIGEEVRPTDFVSTRRKCRPRPRQMQRTKQASSSR
jgi:hypothetical protein